MNWRPLERLGWVRFVARGREEHGPTRATEARPPWRPRRQTHRAVLPSRDSAGMADRHEVECLQPFGQVHRPGQLLVVKRPD